MDILSHMIQVSLESSRNKDSTPKLIEQSEHILEHLVG